MIGYALTTGLVGAVAIASLAELGQNVAAMLQAVANALQAAGAG